MMIMSVLRKYLAVALLALASLPLLAVAGDERDAAKERRKFDYFFYEGLKLKNAGEFDAAFDAFSHCLAIDSLSAPVLYELSVLRATGSWREGGRPVETGGR